MHDKKEKKNESRKDRKAREKVAKTTTAEKEEADHSPRVPEVESFGVGPDDESNPSRCLTGLVRDIQLRWDGTIHFQTCTPEKIVQLKERRAAAVRRQQVHTRAHTHTYIHTHTDRARLSVYALPI